MGTFTIEPGAQLDVVVSVKPVSSSVALVVAQFATLSGAFSNATAVATFPGAQCVQLGVPVVSALSTTLSATISVTQLCGGGLSPGAIAGIAVGCAVVCVVAIIFAILMLRRHKQLHAHAQPFKKSGTKQELAL